MTPMQLPILVYHYFGPDRTALPGMKPWDTAYITPVDLFRSHLQFLGDQGYHPISLRNVLDNSASLPAKPIVLTIDDGHESVAHFAAPILSEFNFPAELFVIPTRVGTPGYADWNVLRLLSASGIAIQSHGLTHRKLTRLNRTEITHELAESRLLIETHGHPSPYAFAVPMGRYPKGLDRELVACGYTVGCTSIYGVNPAPLAPLALQRIMMKAPHDSVTALAQLLDYSSSLAWRMRLRNIAKQIRAAVIG